MADIDIDDLTDGTVGGNGIFDKLMKSVEAHLDEQYDKNRIRGADYTTVYLGSMQTAMSQAIQFLLGEQTADKQAELLVVQAAEVVKATLRTDLESTSKINLIDQQEKESIQQEKLIKEQTASEVKRNIADGIMDLQEVDLSSITNTRNDESTEKVNLLKQQVLKSGAEVGLIGQKKLSEEAQIKNVLDDNTVVFIPKEVDPEGVEISPPIGAGMMGKQQVLLAKQTDGFDRDAEQKATKILMDLAAVRRSTFPDDEGPPLAKDEEIDAFIISLAAGVNTILSSPRYTVGGSIVGLSGTGLVVQVAVNNDPPGDNLPIGANGTFKFITPLNIGDEYLVTVLSHPTNPAQTATITNEGGTIVDANITNISINIITDP